MQPQTGKEPLPVRCAIYARKSTTAGLDRDFHSIDAQREAAQAFIQSQSSEGWVTLPHLYSDGGFTGANLERPGLRRLMSDIAAGAIDCVVVYKVDRLSRSLLDFARLMSLFEKQGVSFVSVTQQFNTAVPVGRLTLNILLSFAEFEREIIRERTRDKKTAARKKGKWTGGYVPLGYNLDGQAGGLRIDAEEAERVRRIYRTFQETGSFTRTLAFIEQQGWTTKSWKTETGKQHAGTVFSQAALVRLLRNVLYAGWTRCEEKLYRGEHEAIIEQGLWKEVNAILDRMPASSGAQARNEITALLKGILRCGSCDQPMTICHSQVKERQYRYYLCRSCQRGTKRSCPIGYLSAPVIERSVIEHLVKQLSGGKFRKQLHSYEGDPGSTIELNRMLKARIEAIVIDPLTGDVVIRPRKVTGDTAEIRYRLPRSVRFSAKAMSNTEQSQPLDPSLPRITQLMALAVKVNTLMHDHPDLPGSELARLAHISSSRLQQILNLLDLAPDIQEQILFLAPSSNREPLTELKLRSIALLWSWAEQRQAVERLLAAEEQAEAGHGNPASRSDVLRTNPQSNRYVLHRASWTGPGGRVSSTHGR